MITQENFINVLNLLNFEQHGQIWTKTINNFELKVDFEKKTLIYPENLGLIINERQTCNFNSPENFVVFECVHRLFEKGYQPKHIELEKKWALGHLQKSGRADICIFADGDKSKMLLIIECKTYGTEYNKALKILKEDGGQLFSYWQQDRSCEWLCLYASDFANDKIEVKYQSIRCLDDKNLLQLAEQDDSILLYKNSHKKEDLHQTWQETYASQLHDNTIFHENTIAYGIGVPPLRKKDLKDFSPDDKIINQFEEILRHNAVSDKENAFNRLIALFICKLVDEYHKSEQSEVEFQYKVNEDDFETLQDRLQKLYHTGMNEFMKEKITYVADDYADLLFARLQSENRTQIINELKQTIRKLKFYTNNDFAFKDVHNEELFMQNGKILVEMVQLFEKYRIVYSAKHQFLGDLFEQLLNKGFKQNEGQFFTPSPITRFIWDSLPIKEKFANNEDYPKVIDYACGSGHFLTEAVEAINAVKNPDDNTWVRDNIFGIEKDYRLARVSQVSMFMNGAGDSNIIFGDGLDNHDKQGKTIQNESFDILVANPPYSVSAFKSHLSLKNNQLNLLKNISNQGGEIEVLFCERIAQLLKSGGMGAVILPSSILSNDSNSYGSARALLLSEFKIHAIVTLGSKTFGATGTNTVILFLEKFNYPPKINSFAKDCANAIFQKQDLMMWNDKPVYDAYLNQIHVDVEIYDKIRLKQITWQEFNEIDNEYLQHNIKAILSKFKFNKTEEKLPDDEKNLLKLKHFLNEFEKNEKEKIEFFFLTYQQKTLIINAPSDNAKQKEFLGYDWSNRKGAEGIQIIKAGGKLYNDKDRFAKNTLASLIRQMFVNKTCQISDEYQEYAYIVKTCDMLDFGLASFNYALRTNIQKKVEIESKYPLVRLNNLISVTRGITYNKDEQVNYPTNNIILPADNISLVGSLDISKMIYLNENKKLDDNKKLKSNDVFICFSSGSEKHIGKLCLIKQDMPYYAGGFMGILRVNNDKKIIPEYLFNLLNQDDMRNIIRQLSNGSNIKNLSNSIGEVKIPLPPLEIQEQIIKECQAIDDEYETSRMSIETYRQKIADIFNALEVVKNSPQGGVKMFKINDLYKILKRGKSAKYGNSSIQIIKSGQARGYTLFDFSTRHYVDENFVLDERQLQKGDILINSTGVGTAGRVTLFELDGVFVVDSHITIFRPNQEKLLPKFGLYSLAHIGFDTIEKMAQGASGQIELNLSTIGNISFPLPNITEQQKIISQIEQYEQEIQKAEQIIKQTAERKKLVLSNYL